MAEPGTVERNFDIEYAKGIYIATGEHTVHGVLTPACEGQT